MTLANERVSTSMVSVLVAVTTALSAPACVVPRGGSWDLADETEKQTAILAPGEPFSVDVVVHASTGAHGTSAFVELPDLEARPTTGVLSLTLSGPDARTDSDSLDLGSDTPPSSGTPGRASAWLNYAGCPDPCPGCRSSDPCDASYHLEASFQGEGPLEVTWWIKSTIGGVSDDEAPPPGETVSVEIVDAP